MGQPGKLPGLIEELKAAGRTFLVALGYPSAAAAKVGRRTDGRLRGRRRSRRDRPAESWAHPGGVVTGISDVAATLTVKRLELLKAFSPK